MDDLISRKEAIDALKHNQDVYSHNFHDDPIDKYTTAIIATDIDTLVNLPSAHPDIEKICARIKAEAIKRNVKYMKHGDRYMLGFVDGMRLARRIVDGTIDDPVYFTTSGEKTE